MSKLIAIAGGSGSGKSTLAWALADEYSDKVQVLNFDDYHKKRFLSRRSFNYNRNPQDKSTKRRQPQIQ